MARELFPNGDSLMQVWLSALIYTTLKLRWGQFNKTFEMYFSILAVLF